MIHESNKYKEVNGTDKRSAVERLEELHPELTSEFKRIQREQYELFCKKQLNYGLSNIAVGTRLETDDEIKTSMTGLWFRINDKIQRLKSLVVLNKADEVGESAVDSYQDISNYSIISQIVNNKKWK